MYKFAKPLRIWKAIIQVTFALEEICKESGMFKYPKVFQCDNEYEFKSSVIKLLKNRNADIKNKNKKIQENLHSFWGTFEKRFGIRLPLADGCSRASDFENVS